VLGYCLPNLLLFDLVVETFDPLFVLVPLSTSVPDLDLNSAFTASVSLWWLLQLLNGGTDRLALICAPFASETALCGPLRGPGHLFDPFPTLCLYFCTVFVQFGSIVGEPTPFSVLGFPTLSSFRIKSGKDPPL
jgi:hypothetical protein